MQVIHITDLHFENDRPFQRALITALLNDIVRKLKAGWLPDAIIFSGDLVKNPDDAGIFQQFDDQFLQPILSASQLSPREIVFCPGNHDVSRKAVTEWADERKKISTALAGDQAALSSYLKTGPAQAYMKAILADYFALMKRCGHEWSDALTYVYDFPKHNISFLSLNSAFGCGLEGSAFDRGKLAIASEQALGAFQSIEKNNRKISLAHHTISDLSEACSRVILPIIESQSSAHLFGHVHKAKPSAVKGAAGNCFLVQGGALYEEKGAYNCFSFIDLGPSEDRIRACYRTYYEDRGTFDEGTNVAPTGIFHSSEVAKAYWENLVPPASNDDVCMWMMEQQPSVEKDLDKTITGRGLRETFVEPVISRKGNAGAGDGRVTTEQILKGDGHIVIACEAEYGATSLLNYLTTEFYVHALSLPRAQVPCLIDARSVKRSYASAVESALRGGFPDSSDPRLKLQSLHDTGRLVVLVDDVDPSNQAHSNFIKGVRSKYPKARLIVAVKMPFIDTQRVQPMIGIDEFDFMQLRTLTRNRVRGLVEKWILPARYQTDAVVEEISSKFAALGIPQTAAYVAIYLSVIQEIDGFNPINSSTVIEQFVESALQKYKPVYAFRSSFDYRNQIDYLGVIAEHMVRANSFVVEYEGLYEWTKLYFQHIGQEHDITKLISYFVENKVFAHEGNSVYFRYNIFLSFFIAHRMQQSDEFRGWLLQEHRYTNYVAEVDIYCGLSRGDAAMIECFSSEFEKVSKTLEELVKPLAWTDRLEKLALPIVEKSETDAFAEGIAKQLTSDMPAEKRDEAVSTESRDVKPDLNRPEVVGILPIWIMTLRAYTVSLKNLENLPNADKERHLQRILQGWATVMLYACIVFREMVERKTVQVGPMKFSIAIPEGIDARLLRVFFVHIPNFICDWVRRDLGSQKLTLQLKNKKIPQTLSESFLQTALFADLKLNEYLGQLQKLKDEVVEADSRVFMEFMLIKLRDIYMRLGLQHDEESGFLRLAAELSAGIKGLEGKEKQREIDRFSADLRRRGQVKALREGS